MDLSSRTQQPQQPQPTESASEESTSARVAHKPKLTMIWLTETVGDRTRLFAVWTTQD